VPQAQHHLTEGQHHFERSENIIPHLCGHKRTMLHYVQMMRCFASMMLRFAQKGSYISPTRKALDFGGLFVFLGVKNTTLSPLHLFPDLMGLNLRLYENLLKNSDLFDIISVEDDGIMKKFVLSLFLPMIAVFIFE
jgi:hypothetical protein